jgi:diguanylate cyclase (GGDEF)-like protein/PAS domain S-box-containing protein
MRLPSAWARTARRWGWRRIGVLWLLPVIGLSSTLGMYVLLQQVDRNHAAQLQLAIIDHEASNEATAAAWSYLLPNDASTARATIVTSNVTIAEALRQFSSLVGDAARAQPVVDMTKSLTDYIALSVGLPSVGSSPLTALTVSAGTKVYADFWAAITASKAYLADRAARSETIAETGTAFILLVTAGMVMIVTWRGQVQRRRHAIADAQRKALQESERSFRVLFEGNPLPMWVFDEQTLKIRSVNDAAVELYGFSRDEFLSMSVLEVCPTEARDALAATLSAEGAWPRQYSGQHHVKLGRTLDVDITVDELEFRGEVARLLVARDVTEQRLLESELRVRAFHDALTGLANRELIAERFALARQSSPRDGNDLVVVLIDVDGFKGVNDSLGHLHGDELLRGIAGRLNASIRTGDTAAGMGGDEFALLLEDIDPAAASTLAQRVLDALAEPFSVGGLSARITASAGLASLKDSGDSWEECLRHADAALSEAKSSGKACHRVFRAGMSSPLLERLEMAADLRVAVGRGEMSLHYQPIVSMRAGERRVWGVEALARWAHPTRGNVGPDRFIPIAEETGVIVALGAWVLETACRQVAWWDATGPAGLSISINVSARQLQEAGFVDTVTRVLFETALAPHRLTLEVTETALLPDMDTARARLSELRDLGVRIALDDFGAGYSSLAYLQELPLDTVKIDRVFISALTTHAERRPLLLSLVRLLQSLDVVTVAEGVETEEQLAYITGIGIDFCQGFLFSPAVPHNEAAAAISRCSSTLLGSGATTTAA